jgi:hypothetical protein
MMSNTPDIHIAKAYLQKNQSAASRGIEFKLSFAEFKSLISSRNCFYTGVKLRESTFSIDRIDSSKGYTVENCVACLKSLNSLKGMIEDPSNELTIEVVLNSLLIAQERIDPSVVKKFERKVKTTRGKLTDDDVRAIRASRDKLKDIASVYGVSMATISHVRTGLIHKSVKP